MGCIITKRNRRKVAPLSTRSKGEEREETVVEVIYLPLSLQPALEEPRQRDPEGEVLKRLQDDGLLKSETLREVPNGNVAFYVSLDGNPYPSGKPRLLEPIELKQERAKLAAQGTNRMDRANSRRRQRLAGVERRARIASARQRQVVAKVHQDAEEKRLIYKDRLAKRMEKACKNRQLRQARGK